jgi:hypothetical protein
LPSSTPSLTGNNVDFAPTTVSQSVAGTAQFTATAPTTVSSFTETGSAFSAGTPDQSLPASLSIGQTISVPVTFTPNAIGGLSGSLTANLSAGTATVSLTGQGLSATEPLNASEPLSTSPGSAAFSDQPIGGTMVSQPVTFTNVSLSNVSVTGFSAPALPFAVPDPPANQTINPGGTLTFTVDFSPPGSSGNFEHVFGGVATLVTNDGNFGVPVSGAADPPAQININPTTLNFGDVTVGSSSTLNFDVGDQGGFALTITQSTPPATSGFTALTTLASGVTIDGNTSNQETVQFAPTSPGPVSATWILEGNDGSGPQTVTITGTGVSPSPPPPPPTMPTSTVTNAPPPVQAVLDITTLSGHLGTPLALKTSGDPGGGAVTFTTKNGTATGCIIKGASLSVGSAGSCIVTATKSAGSTGAAVSSSATTVTFTKVSRARIETVTVMFAAQSSALNAGAKSDLLALAKKLVAGDSVMCTGYAKSDAVLARRRATVIANFLSNRVKLRLTLKSVTNVASENATVKVTS